MTNKKYTETKEYQKEIADQYKKRVAKFPKKEVARILGLFGFRDIKVSDISEATAGNWNATYLTPNLVIKINKKEGSQDYVANKLVSDRLSQTSPVVKVLAYDYFEKTDYEVLIMERTKGTLLLDDIFELNKKEQIILFEQVFDLVNKLFTIKFNDFGRLMDEKNSFSSYPEFLKHEFNEHIRTIRKKKLVKEKDIEKIEKYFFGHVDVFNDKKSVFVFTDLHMGNILHERERLTAVIDYDYSLKAPKVRILLSLLGLIDYPAQFVEGTKYYQKFKGKNFYHLLPTLRKKLADVFADSNLLRKLNVLFISEGVMWIAGDWSKGFNKEMTKMITDGEIAETDKKLNKTYYGKVLTK